MDRDIHLHASLNVDVEDLAEGLRRRLEVDQTLVNAQLVEVPGLGTLTVGRLTRVVAQNLWVVTCRQQASTHTHIHTHTHTPCKGLIATASTAHVVLSG